MNKKIKEYVKEEFLGWKSWEIVWLSIACITIFALSVYWKDTVMGVISATTGVACVVCTGKGKLTYKLKWNGGDMKSVQGDSGHARMDMVADVYSHIIDEDRRYNAQKFEEQFYNAKGLKNAEEGKTAPMPKFETSVELLDPMAEVQKESEVEKEKPAENSTDENAALLAKLLSNPETAALLKALAKTI